MGFRRRQDKLDRRRRLLESFQKCVERILGNLVHFVDHVDLESALGRLIAHILDDLANFIDATVRGAVDFKNVDGGACGNFLAMAALVARVGRRPLFAIEGFG